MCKNVEWPDFLVEWPDFLPGWLLSTDDAADSRSLLFFYFVNVLERRSKTAFSRSILTAKLTAKPVDNSGF
jgi:hypothetical protein